MRNHHDQGTSSGASVAHQAIGEALRHATDAGALAGVVAMAATGKDIIYEGAFGRRDLSRPDRMTTDSVFMLASMTKAVTSVAAMQLVEQGKLSLDDPLDRLLPELAAPLVFEGFAGDGTPNLRSANRPITLRHLLTHTAGFTHQNWNPDIGRYQVATGTPDLGTGTNASLRLPLLFDPGERWEYGISLEWVGKAIEAASGKTLGAYFRDRVTGPLGMDDTAFGAIPAHRDRLVSTYRRDPSGSLQPIEIKSSRGEYEAGGGGLYSSALDYIAFLQMLLNHGQHNDERILKPETVQLMGQNHIGDLEVTKMTTVVPAVSNDFELFPGMAKKWGLSALINTERGPNGRSAGSLSWGGIANSYFWADPTKQVAGVFMTQLFPFGDPMALDLCGGFERRIYESLGRAPIAPAVKVTIPRAG